MGERVAEREMDAEVGLSEELQSRREDVHMMTTQINRHSATEKQNVEAGITHSCLAFQPSSDPVHCLMQHCDVLSTRLTVPLYEV